MAIRILCRKLAALAVSTIASSRLRISPTQKDEAPRLCATEQASQFLLRGFQGLSSRGGQLIATAIDIERQHRHGGAIRIGLTSMARLRGPFERTRDALRILAREDSLLKIERVTIASDLSGPPLL